MAILARDWHQIDESHGSFNTRKIGKWLNFKTPSGLMSPIDTAIEEPQATPPDWQGAFDFQRVVLRQPLQCFVGDSTDAANRALWGMRLAAAPDCWVNYKAVNVNPVEPVYDVPNHKVTWPGLWDFADLELEVGRHRFGRKITLTGAGHPVSFRFAIRLPAGCWHEIANNAITFHHPTRGQYMHTVAGNGYGANASEESPNVPVSLIAAPDVTVGQRTFPTFRIVPDVSAATYPVVM